MKLLTGLVIVSVFALTGCAHKETKDCSKDKKSCEMKSCDMKNRDMKKHDKKKKSCELKKDAKKKSCCM